MSFMHSKLVDAQPAGVLITTKVLDTTKVVTASLQFTLAGATSPSIAIVLQGSNAVPPNGQLPNQSPTTGVSSGWTPPAGSWVQVYAQSSPVSSTMAANGTVVLGVSADGLLMRWLRATITPSSANGGTMTVEAFMRDVG